MVCPKQVSTPLPGIYTFSNSHIDDKNQIWLKRQNNKQYKIIYK